MMSHEVEEDLPAQIAAQLEIVYQQLLAAQIDLDDDIRRVLYANLWTLYS